MNFGRNDPCPCGSGKKYKRCCLNLNYAPPGIDSRRGSLLKRNLLLIDWIQDILGLKKRDWMEVKRLLNNDQVRQIYKVVAYAWPRDTNLSALLPTPSAKLRGLFLGIQRPENILANVLRYSLYSG
jgi:hypothetical protein